MNTSFSGRKVLITGGTKGLGFVTAQLFAKQGAHIYVSYRSDESNAKNAVQSIRGLGVECEAFRCDLSENGSIDQLFKQINEKTDQLDFYIHNAAATAFKNLLDIQAHHIDKTFNITVKAFILGVQHAVRLMKNGGAIVSISGMDTLKAVPKHGLLGAAKSALETLTSYYAHELARQKVRVNCVNPGFFDTESTRKYLGPLFELAQKQLIHLTPSRQAASLEDIAKVILFLCSENANWVIGQTIRADGGADFTLPLSLG